MAPEPQLNDFGALAIKPPRVNIFARPAASNHARADAATAPLGAFDASAACHPEPVTDRITRERDRSPARTRVAGIVALALAGIAAVVIETSVPHRPSVRPAV